MTPATHDFVRVRGTTEPFAFRLTIPDDSDPPVQVPIPLTSMVMTIKSGTTVLTVNTDDGVDGDGFGFVYDEPSNTATFTPTAAQTRAFKPDVEGVAQNDYELEIRNGPSEMVYLSGKISAIGGINTDE